MSANRYDFLKEKIDFSQIPNIEEFSFKPPSKEMDEFTRALIDKLNENELSKEYYTTETNNGYEKN